MQVNVTVILLNCQTKYGEKVFEKFKKFLEFAKLAKTLETKGLKLFKNAKTCRSYL